MIFNIESGNWDVPLCEFIIQTSDPTYWSVYATALIKSISIEITDELSERDLGIINKSIRKLENFSHQFISTAFEISQDKTVKFLKEARIGGFSIIGEQILLLSSGFRTMISFLIILRRLPDTIRYDIKRVM